MRQDIPLSPGFSLGPYKRRLRRSTKTAKISTLMAILHTSVIVPSSSSSRSIYSFRLVSDCSKSSPKIIRSLKSQAAHEKHREKNSRQKLKPCSYSTTHLRKAVSPNASPSYFSVSLNSGRGFVKGGSKGTSC